MCEFLEKIYAPMHKLRGYYKSICFGIYYGLFLI